MSAKRALWLINNPFVREYEVGRLIENGYEVFTPKVVDISCGLEGSSVTWEYDQTLSLLPEQLKCLNETDFYREISEETASIINENFEIAFIQYFSEQLRMLVTSFQGNIVLRAYGRSDEDTYTQRITEDLGYGFHKRLKQLGDRFWFTELYPGLAEREGDYIRRRSKPLPDAFPVKTGNTAEIKAKLLVYCPGINFSTRQHNDYLALESLLKKMSHTILGVQPIPVSGKENVTNSDDVSQLTSAAALFEPAQHSFAAPFMALYAMAAGVPVVYRNDGPIKQMKSKCSHVGGCDSPKEALQKIKRLLCGDSSFVQQLLQDQEKMCSLFLEKEADEKWNAFLTMAEQKLQAAKKVPRRPFKIGIIMPSPYTGGVLDYASRLMKCIKWGAEKAGDRVELSFAYTNHPVFEEQNYFKPFEEENIPVCSFSWAKKDGDWLRRAVSLDGCQMKAYSEECWIMDNVNTNFEECDYLILVADRAPGVVYSRCPMAVVAHDFIQRYVPEIVTPDYENVLYQFQRQADAVFVTSKPNYIDALQCGGNRRDRTYLTPLMYDLVPEPKSDEQKAGASDSTNKSKKKKQESYFLWSTNTARHKNHSRALRGLREYYARGGTLKCYMTGGNTAWLNIKNNAPEDAYIQQIRHEIDSYPELKGKLLIWGEFPKAQYLPILKKAKFVFHPGYADNGNGTVVDAACLGVPSISSDYPAMRYIDEQVHLGMHFFEPFDSEDMARALLEAERDSIAYAEHLPSREELKSYTVEGRYEELYRIVRKVTGIGT